ncbi:Protein of unknown function [Rhizobiales bacterium GAS113]|nr:Protein of unknown function [Rhizobiales bacterium GAS113]
MSRWIAAVLALLALTLGPTAVHPAKAAEQVDLLLVLAADVSRSIDDQKFELERRGYAAALSDPRVLQAIAAGPNGRIAIAFVEWAGANSQNLLIDWTLVRDGNDTKLFVNRLLEAPRSFADRTAIGAGIDFARTQFARSPYASDRRVIDVSGDGTNNSGRDVRAASDEAVGNEVTTINGLVILSNTPIPYNPEHTNPPGGLENYYRENVIGGTNAFVMVAESFESFGKSIVAKLIREISALPKDDAASYC